jgi:endonuclease/exonuclease/phosphatase family metal-dependent hydrolase
VDDQTAISEVLATDIRQFERMKGHDRTMVVGDFNMSPFENGMVGARELHGVSSEYVAMQGARVVRGESYPFFFNPTWSLIASRRNHAPGTHFHSRSSYFEHFWHTFDQVLVRPSLRSAFNLDSLRIVTSAGTATLLDSQGKPDKIGASDHLPILFDMDL